MRRIQIRTRTEEENVMINMQHELFLLFTPIGPPDLKMTLKQIAEGNENAIKKFAEILAQPLRPAMLNFYEPEELRPGASIEVETPNAYHYTIDVFFRQDDLL